MFVWYQHLNIPPSWYWVLFKPVRDFSGYSQKTLNQWQSSWHGGGHLTFLEWSLTHFGRARCCSFLARWKVSANLWQVVQEGPLNRGITRIWCCPQLTWVSTLFWEGLCCQYWYQCWYQAQFYIPDQYSYTLSTSEKNTDPMWRVLGF